MGKENRDSKYTPNKPGEKSHPPPERTPPPIRRDWSQPPPEKTQPPQKIEPQKPDTNK